MRALYDDESTTAAPDAASTNAMLRLKAEGGGTAEEVEADLRSLVEEAKAAGGGAGGRGGRSGEEPRRIAPNAATFCLVLHRHAVDGNFERAESILRWMESLHSEGVISEGPDLPCHNAVLDALSKSGGGTAAESAEMWLRRMEDGGGSSSGIRPDAVSYSCVIDLHARRSGKGGGGSTNP